jgi:hypothetical protein
MTATIKRDSPRRDQWVDLFGSETVRLLPDRTAAGALKVDFESFSPAIQREIALYNRDRLSLASSDDAFRQLKACGYFAVHAGEDVIIEDQMGLFA